VWALRRYLYLLSHAEATASQADCPACGAYGRLELLHAADRQAFEAQYLKLKQGAELSLVWCFTLCGT
jgi:hypothetical protein